MAYDDDAGLSPKTFLAFLILYLPHFSGEQIYDPIPARPCCGDSMCFSPWLGELPDFSRGGIAVVFQLTPAWRREYGGLKNAETRPATIK